MKVTGRKLLKISALADKLNIDIDMDMTEEELGKEIIKKIILKAYTAEEEVSELLGLIFNCDPKEALDIDLVEKWKEFSGTDIGKVFLSFFTSAAKSKAQNLENS